MQDWQKTRGFSISGGITIGPNSFPLPDSFGLGQVKGNKSWSEVSEIIGKGDTVIRVGGSLDLKAATIASTTDKLDLRASACQGETGWRADAKTVGSLRQITHLFG